MIFETGTIVFLSLIVLVWRLPRNTLLWLFGHPLWLELPFSLAAYALHWGTFSGMIAAATAACICFCFMQAGKWYVGYVSNGKYYPGVIKLEARR